MRAVPPQPNCSGAHMRLLGVLFVIFGLCQGASAQSQSRVVPYVSPDGTFRAVFPCQPAPQPLPAASGASMTLLLINCEENNLFAGIVERQLAVVLDVDALLNEMRREVIAA